MFSLLGAELKDMTRTLLVLAIAASLAAACGSKAKKETTTEVTEAPEASAPAAAEEVAAPETAEVAPDPARDLGERIYFEFDSSTLSPEARGILDNNAEWLKENPGRSLTIEGHTDEQGTEEYNVALGDQRARTARDYIVALGIEEGRIKIISYGEEKLAAAGDDASNRRSMFIVQR